MSPNSRPSYSKNLFYRQCLVHNKCPLAALWVCHFTSAPRYCLPGRCCLYSLLQNQSYLLSFFFSYQNSYQLKMTETSVKLTLKLNKISLSVREKKFINLEASLIRKMFSWNKGIWGKRRCLVFLAHFRDPDMSPNQPHYQQRN